MHVTSLNFVHIFQYESTYICRCSYLWHIKLILKPAFRGRFCRSVLDWKHLAYGLAYPAIDNTAHCKKIQNNTLTNELRDHTEQSHSCEVTSLSTRQEIPWILWNPNPHYSVQNNLPLSLSSASPSVPIQFNIHFNITFPSMPMSSEWSLSLRFPNQHPVHTSPCSKVPHKLPITFFSGLYYPKTICEEYKSQGTSIM